MTTWRERADALTEEQIQRALDESERLGRPVADVRNFPKRCSTIIRVAELLAKHEPAPVCPKLAAAREACAKAAERIGSEGMAAEYRAGLVDDRFALIASLSAINIYLEQNNETR